MSNSILVNFFKIRCLLQTVAHIFYSLFHTFTFKISVYQLVPKAGYKFFTFNNTCKIWNFTRYCSIPKKEKKKKIFFWSIWHNFFWKKKIAQSYWALYLVSIQAFIFLLNITIHIYFVSGRKSRARKRREETV